MLPYSLATWSGRFTARCYIGPSLTSQLDAKTSINATFDITNSLGLFAQRAIRLDYLDIQSTAKLQASTLKSKKTPQLKDRLGREIASNHSTSLTMIFPNITSKSSLHPQGNRIRNRPFPCRNLLRQWFKCGQAPGKFGIGMRRLRVAACCRMCLNRFRTDQIKSV